MTALVSLTAVISDNGSSNVWFCVSKDYLVTLTLRVFIGNVEFIELGNFFVSCYCFFFKYLLGKINPFDVQIRLI